MLCPCEARKLSKLTNHSFIELVIKLQYNIGFGTKQSESINFQNIFYEKEIENWFRFHWDWTFSVATRKSVWDKMQGLISRLI